MDMRTCQIESEVNVETLRRLLSDGKEIALLDTREEGVYACGHLLLAASLPLSRLELDATWRVPRHSTRIVIVDSEPENAARARRILLQGGYQNVAVLRGGVSAWTAKGHPVFSGLYVPSKAFGEVVEHHKATPRITAEQLAAMRVESMPFLLLDSRPLDEFRQFSLPGARNCPGAELVARAWNTVPADVPIIVNCAGRTRSIIGAQSLINAGIANPVFALENGTMGWHLSGRALAHNQDTVLEDAPSSDMLAAGQQAMQLFYRTGGKLIDCDALHAMLSDSQRTTYFYDVRQPLAFETGHVAGARSAPGGQLVQCTDVFAPVRGARIVLVDDHMVQAPMTAHWLRQMGWEAFVLDATGIPRVRRTPEHTFLLQPGCQASVGPYQLDEWIREQAVDVINCDDSRLHTQRHIPSACFAVRSRMAEWIGAFCTSDKPIVFISEDGRLARFAAADARQYGYSAGYLEGGTQAWLAAGLPTSAGMERSLSDTDDAWYSPYQLDEEFVADAMREYISWETGLLHAIALEPGVRFNVL